MEIAAYAHKQSQKHYRRNTVMDEQRAWSKARRKRCLRILAVILSFCVLIHTYPDILATFSAFAATGQEQPETQHITGFTALSEEIREQTVPVGTALSELTLPDTLEAVVTEQLSENAEDKTDGGGKADAGEDVGKEDAGGNGSDEDSEENDGEEPNDTEDEDGGTGETEEGEPADPEPEDTETGGETEDKDAESGDGQDEQPETGDGQDEQPENGESEETDGTAATENGDEGDTETEENSEGESVPAEEQGGSENEQENTPSEERQESAPAEETHTVSLPQITVTVENDTDAVMQTLLDRIAALPDAEGYLAAEPDIDDWEGDEDDYEEACTLWMEKLYEYAEEALAIFAEYEVLTEEQQAFVSEKALAKLTAWVEIAETAGESTKVMAAAAHSHDGISFDTPLTAAGGELASGDYYLAEDVALENSITIPSDVVVNLCLNGHTLHGTGGNPALWLYGTLNVYDCQGGGVLNGDSADGDKNSAIAAGAQKNPPIFNLYGGKITASAVSVISWGAGTCNLHGGSVEGGRSYAICNYGTVIISGDAAVSGGTDSISASFAVENKSNAVLTVKDDASISSSEGDGVLNDGTVNLEGGTITSTKANRYGIMNGAFVNITGGEVTGGRYGIYMYNENYTLKLSGSPAVSGGTAALYLRTENGTTLDNVRVDATGYTGGTLTVKDFYYRVDGYIPVEAGSYAIKTGERNKDKFTLVDSKWWYSYKDGGLYLDTHAHSYTYTARGAVITESCTCGHEETATLSLQSGADPTYTGSAVKPVTVTYSDGWAGTGENRPDDSQIIYENNTNAGTAKAKLTIAGKTAVFDFSIAGADLTGVTASGYTGTYDAAAHGITVSVPTGATVNYRKTASGDYTLTSAPTYTNAGIYTVYYQVTKDNYKTVTGSAQVKINACSISGAAVTLNNTVLTYNGFSQTKRIESVTVTSGGKTLTLTAGTDYTVSGNQETNAGSHKMTLTGNGNYNGTKEVSFEIKAKTLTPDMVTIASDTHYYTGSAITPAVTVKDGSTLVSGTDYEVTYSDNTAAGEAKVVVTGKENYSGTVTGTFTIRYRELPAGKTLEDYATIAPAPKDGWNNSNITLTPKDGISIGETADGIGADTIVVDEESGKSGGTKTIYIRDEDGNVYQTDYTYKLDKTPPTVTGLKTENRTQDGAEITFTPSEGGKVYWVINSETKPDAENLVQQAAQEDNVQTVTEGASKTFAVEGLTPGETHTVYIVVEDAAGNLSEVKEITFTTLQAAPNITLDDLIIDHAAETIKVSDSVGEVEVYTDPANPEDSRITPGADGSLPVEPGASVYIRYPEKREDGEVTPPGDCVKIDIPGRPAAPAPKQVTMENTEEHGVTVTVTAPRADEEYILVEKGGTPDWSNPNTTGEFTGMDPGKEYDLWVRKKATDSNFASDPVKTKIRTPVTVKSPVVTGEGAGKSGNTAPKPTAPDSGNETVTFTGTYAEEYTPVIKVGGQEITPEMTWDEGTGKGEWKYPYPIPDGTAEVEITVEFRKRRLTAITVTPDSLNIYADHAANQSAVEAGTVTPLTTWLEGECEPKAAYDNKTEASVQVASYATINQFVPKGGVYSYVVSAEGKTAGITLTVLPVNAAVTAPDKVVQVKKNGGYTQAEVAAWLPAQAVVTYTGTGYTTKTEKRAVTWDTASIGADFGGTLGVKTLSGTVDLPTWATGQADVNISIEFTDKMILTDAQMTLAISGWTYGAQEQPVPRGSVSVTDANPAITYLYSADQGTTWKAAEQLPRAGSGHIVPGAYQVKMTYTGDGYIGTKTAVFTVEKLPLTVEKGTLEAETKNYDGTLTAALKEGGKPALSGVLTGDAVSVCGTLRAEFAEAGPKKNVPVTVTGFELAGRDAGCYCLGNDAVTLQATINKADGTSPSDGQKPGGGDKDKDEDKEQNGNGGTTSGALSPAETDAPMTGRSDSGQGDGASRKTGEQPAQDTAEKPEDRKEQEGSAAETEKQDGQKTAGLEDDSLSDSGTTKELTAIVDGGKLIVSDADASAGNVAGMKQTSTAMMLGEGTVFVTVVCKEEKYTAGVRDTAAVANAVLLPEHIQLVNNGETIEIRVDVKDISQLVPQQDKDIIESGLVKYQEEVPDLVLGRYVDISMFMRLGKGDWDAVTSTEEPIDVVIGVPEDMREEGREFYIIRAHEGEHTLMRDLDEEPDTITISTDKFSSYAIAYAAAGANNVHKCSLCHICPTFLGICYFIWLAIIIALVLVTYLVIQRKRKQEESEEQ